jgi:hypothetical protein
LRPSESALPHLLDEEVVFDREIATGALERV